MKTIKIHNQPDIPVRRFANMILVQAVKDSGYEICFRVDKKPSIAIDGVELAPPPDHLMPHIITVYIKFAYRIRWPWRRSINNKRFRTVCDGNTQIWSLNSVDVKKELRITRESGDSK